MKKLGKLNLKAEKMLNHEELVRFKGGSGSQNPLWCGCTTYNCTCPNSDITFSNYMCTAEDLWVNSYLYCAGPGGGGGVGQCSC